MIIYVLGIFALAFVVFFLAADSMNPFVKPKGYIRRSQWRYGRRVGEAALIVGAIFIMLQQFTPISTLEAIIACTILFAISWGLIAMRLKFGR